MKNVRLALVVAILATVPAAFAARADRLEEKLAGNFFLPELVKKNVEILNLTEDQKTSLASAYENSQQKVGDLKQQAEAETDKLVELTKPQHVDEKAIFDEGEKLLALDHEIKHTQLALLITIKNSLTPEQQAVLNNIKLLDPKMKQALALADKWKADGRDLSPFEGAKSEFESNLKDGKTREAEAVLDRVIKALGEPAK